MLHLLLQQQKVQIDNINNLLVEILKEICNKCKISTSQRSIVSIYHSAKYSFIRDWSKSIGGGGPEQRGGGS